MTPLLSAGKCVMVDIDQLACEMCLKHLPEWADGCDKDPRFEVTLAHPADDCLTA